MNKVLSHVLCVMSLCLQATWTLNFPLGINKVAIYLYLSTYLSVYLSTQYEDVDRDRLMSDGPQ